MSITVTFSGNSSELTANFFPELELDDRFEYSCGLLDFTTYQSIANIHNGNNKIYFRTNTVSDNISDKDVQQFGILRKIEIPVGSYELKEIADYLEAVFEKFGITFSLTVNKNTLKTTILCSTALYFDEIDSMRSVFGFNTATIEANVPTESQDIIRITQLNTIIVECDIVNGSYINGQKCHSLYEFAPNVEVGYKIIESPRNIVYLPVTTNRIRSIQIKIVDQDRNPIDFRGEKITCRIHIKRGD